MQLVFLSARLPLTKTFVADAGRLSATPYPHVSRVTSHHEHAATLQDFKALLDTHAANDHCLFGGQLTHPLTNESRAGKSLPRPRDWIVFDFDRVQAKTHEEVVARFLPLECQNTSYIAQLSASMFRPDSTTWSGHIFMLVKESIEAQRLKQWFEYLNFTLPALTEAVTLSDSLQALHWPLDRTVAYDSKLIYIAPPRCYGFEPAVKQHIQFVKKKLTHLTIPNFTPIDHFTIRQKINELRRAVGEQEIEYELTTFDGHEMLRKTGVCDVQGLKASGDHYVRFNLNGGDSYAYFIDLRNPDVIRNFKGEPFLQTRAAAPDLYKSLRKAAAKAVSKPPLDDGSDVLAFYATNQNSKLKIGVYNGVTKELELNNASIDAARSWLYEFGLVQRDPFGHKYLTFDPLSNTQYVSNSSRINLFTPTAYMTNQKTSDRAATLRDLPPIANKIIRSVLGPCDEKVVEHFVNWMAYIFQKRNKTQTAWVLNGVPGTGKNTLVKHYLRPLLGNRHVASIQYPALNKEYNGFLEEALLVVIEEADIRGVDNEDEAMAKLTHWITDSPVMIRRMSTDHYEAANYSSFLLFTNQLTPAKIAAADRRFNFGERQDVRWFPTPNEVQAYSSGAELTVFADVLQRWPIDEQAVTRIVETQARIDAHEATTGVNQLIAEALIKGDLQFFIDRLPSNAEAQSDFSNGRFNPIGLFKANLSRYQADATAKRATVVSEEEAFVLFRTLIPDPRYLQDSKTWRKRHYKSLGLDLDKQHRLPTDPKARVRGIKVDWKTPTTAMPADNEHDNVTSIGRPRKTR